MKYLIRALFCCVLVLALSAPAVAADQSPTELIRSTVDKIITLLKEGGYNEPSKKQELLERLDPCIHKVFDFEELSRRSVGRQWNLFKPEQQEQFVKLFADLLAETYVDRLLGYEDEEVIYIGERTSDKGNVEVRTAVAAKGKEIPIYYRMHETEKGWMIYDVKVEGISLVQNYRTQFQETLVNKSPQYLLDKLKAQVEALKARSATY